MNTFIKWVGGKSKLFPLINNWKPKKFNNYIEPFVGGGYVFLNLHETSKIIISDLNKLLITTYKCIKENYLRLIKEIDNLVNLGKDYYEIREMDRQKEYENLDPYIKAARFIYLNKNCFNGIYRENSKGFFNVPQGRYKNVSLYNYENLKEISDFLNEKDVEIINKDFREMKNLIKENDFIYLDPPYDPIDKTQSFTSYNANGFSEDDQIDLKEFCDFIDSRKAFLCCLIIKHH